MKKILIVSHHDACRSAMALGWFKYYGKNAATFTSAGTEPTQTDLRAAQSMMDAVIDITKHQPNSLFDLTDKTYDIVVVLDKDSAPAVKQLLKFTSLYVHHFNPPAADESDEPNNRKAYDALRDELEDFTFDFIHEHVKKLM